MTLLCSVCKEIKDFEFFAKDSTRSRGYMYWCKKCRNLRERNNYKPGRHRESYLLRKYNMSVQDYENLVKKYNNVCPICNETKHLVVDHCHSTGKVRGLLCSGCNASLGHMRDKIENLKRAIAYIENVGV